MDENKFNDEETAQNDVQAEAPAVETTAVQDEQPSVWSKVKQTVLKITDKIAAVATDAAENTKIALTDAISAIKKECGTNKADCLFEKKAERLTREQEGSELYAITDEAAHTITVRAGEELPHLTVVKRGEQRLIVLSEGEKKPFPYLLSDGGKEISVSCNKVTYLEAYSKTLCAAKQVLIYQSFSTLDPMINGYQPSFFKRGKFSEFKQDYLLFKETVLSGGSDEKLYARVADQMNKLLPEGLTALNSIHLQLS